MVYAVRGFLGALGSAAFFAANTSFAAAFSAFSSALAALSSALAAFSWSFSSRARFFSFSFSAALACRSACFSLRFSSCRKWPVVLYLSSAASTSYTSRSSRSPSRCLTLNSAPSSASGGSHL